MHGTNGDDGAEGIEE